MKDVIKEMERYAEANNVPIIERDSIEFIRKYIKINNVKSILEIGTAIGYSAIKMAEIDPKLEVTTIERDEKKYREAVKNVNECGMDQQINIVFNDALDVNLAGHKYDLIFIDAAKGQYIKFFEKFQNYLNSDTNINESVDSKVSKIIKALLIHELSGQPLSQEIEDKIYKFMEYFNTKSVDLDFQTKELIVKGCIIRDLLEGTPNPRVQVPNMPFNLKKDEKLIYAFQIPVKEVVTKKERIAGSKGVSIRVMKGVYYHIGGSKGQTIETKVNQSLGICSVAVTNQYIYIMSPETSFRIAFNKIVSIYNNGDSVIIYRDGAKNNPLMLEYNDTWFLYNILQNATNW